MNRQTERKCVFCDNPAGSREHALPRWVVEVTGLADNPVLSWYVSDQTGVELQGGPRGTDNLVTKRVCHSCNTGWMSDLENQVKTFIEPLIRPDRIDFPREELQQLCNNEPTLRRWLVKTAETLSHLASQSGVQQIPSHYGPLVREDQTPDTCLIYAGWLPSGEIKSVIGRGFQAFNNGVFSRNLESAETFNFSIQLNHLALRITNAPPSREVNRLTGHSRRLDSNWILMTWNGPDGRSCSPSFVTPRTAFMEKFDSPLFQNFNEFSKACIMCTGHIPTSFEVHELDAAQESLQRPMP